MKKIKVTKRVAAKVPWYEKPPLLFSAIAAVLLIAGVAMGRFTTKAPDTTMLGAGSADSSQVAAALVPTEQALFDNEYNALFTLDADQPFPPSGLSHITELGPVRVPTLNDAASLRGALRAYLQLTAYARTGSLTGYGYIPATGFAAALAHTDSGGDSPTDWVAMVPDAEFDQYGDYECYLTASGGVYILAFVGKETAVAINRADQLRNLKPVPEVPEIPAWQFWRKPPPIDPLLLYSGAEFSVFPDLRPDAPCAFLIPAERIEFKDVVTIRDGVSHPVQTLRLAVK